MLRFWAFALLGLSLTSRVTVAAGTADKEMARAKFREGLAKAEAADYAAAAALFEAALSLYPTKNTMFNLAKAYRLDNRYVASRETFSRLSAEYGAVLSDEMKQAIMDNLDELAERIAVLRIHASPPEAVIWIDDEKPSLDDNGEILLDPGAYVIEVTAPGYSPKQRKITVASGAKRTERFVLATDERKNDREEITVPSGSDEAGSVTLSNREVVDDAATSLLSVACWTGAGGAVAAGTAASIFWVLAGTSYDEYSEINQRVATGAVLVTDTDALNRRDEAFSDMNRRMMLGLGFSIATGVLAATAAAVFAVKQARENESRTSVYLTPTGVGGKF